VSEIHIHDVIVRPVITEKTQLATSDHNVYCFEVHMRANKPMIKEAVETLFGVEVLRVRTAVMPAKLGHRQRKTYIRKSEWKKAVVTVAPGQTIDMFGA
jgi:large subunit ribosomal protein L23